MLKQYIILMKLVLIKQTRVAEWLGVSRANVSQVIGRMQNNGLIELTDELKLSKKVLI